MIFRTSAVIATLLFLVIGQAILLEPARGASATGRVVATVVSSFSVTPLVNLAFPIAYPGDGALVIEPGENVPGSGAIQVQGEANLSYTVRLPDDIVLSKGEGGKGRQIAVQDFTSLPAGQGVIDRNGRQTMYLGATRGALPPDQEPGTYTGSYTVEIIY